MEIRKTRARSLLHLMAKVNHKEVVIRRDISLIYHFSWQCKKKFIRDTVTKVISRRIIRYIEDRVYRVVTRDSKIIEVILVAVTPRV